MSRAAQITYRAVCSPKPDCTGVPVLLSDETMRERYEKVLARMREEGLDALVIYGDLEHGHNFAYLTGFLPRFEEALLVVHADGTNAMIMGNENLNKVPHARIPAKAIHAPHFSLPNQPMRFEQPVSDLLREAGLKAGMRIGVVGWKNFTCSLADNSQLYDVPAYLVDELRRLAGEDGRLCNAAQIFIGERGVRTVNNPNELAHYEFGAALASDCMLRAMDLVDVGVSELELGAALEALGQKHSVVTIAAAGRRFEKANLYPLAKTVALGDPISLTVGYRGGLSSRCGYAVHEAAELPEGAQDYLEKVVRPYFGAVTAWLEQIHCGMKGGELYRLVDEELPRGIYHWSLCPGHLTADEEWMSSPVYEGSNEVLTSGMLFQIDIIPSVAGYAGTSAESTVAIADECLRAQIAAQEPQLWARIQERRRYLTGELGIRLHEDVLPMCATVAYLRPFLLNKGQAMGVSRGTVKGQNSYE